METSYTVSYTDNLTDNSALTTSSPAFVPNKYPYINIPYSIIPILKEYNISDESDETKTTTCKEYLLGISQYIIEPTENIAPNAVLKTAYFSLTEGNGSSFSISYIDSCIDKYISYSGFCVGNNKGYNKTMNETLSEIVKSGMFNGYDMFYSDNVKNSYCGSVIEELVNSYINSYTEIPIYLGDYCEIIPEEERTKEELTNIDILHWAKISTTNYKKATTTSAPTEYSKDELNSFAKTFFDVIMKYSTGKEISNDSNLTKQDKIYKSVMNYYRSYKADDVVTGIDLILSSSYTYNSSNNTLTSSSSSSCGCNSGTSTATLSESCGTKYTTAMKTWLGSMLSDINNYYNKYFYNLVTDEETGEQCYEVDTELIEALVTLMDEFKEAGYSLDFSSSNSKFNTCNCKSNSNNSTESDCNYKIFDNFKKVLLYIKNDEVTANTNKIKLYGSAFATLLDKMYF